MASHISFAQVQEKFELARPYLRVSRAGAKTYDNLDLLRVELMSAVHQRLDSVDAVSGQSYAQYFRKPRDSQSGSNEPLPEGIWNVQNPEAGTNGVEWADGVGNYGASWDPALGPTWTALVPQRGYETARANIGIHLDANRPSSPGTAGCIGITTLAGLKKFVGWFAQSESAPRAVLVDWNLGVVPDVLSILNAGISFDSNTSSAETFIPARDRIPLIEQER